MYLLPQSAVPPFWASIAFTRLQFDPSLSVHSSMVVLESGFCDTGTTGSSRLWMMGAAWVKMPIANTSEAPLRNCISWTIGVVDE